MPAASAPTPSSPSAALPPPRPNCGLTTPPRIELLPVFRGHAVIRKNLGSVKLRGTPRLIAEPEDFAEFYLAEAAIDPRTLPAELAAMRGAKLNVLQGDVDCHPKLGKVSAFAWADEEGRGWSPSSPRKNAARVFEKGESFLVAELEPTDCGGWGLVTLNEVEGYREWSKVVDEDDPGDGSTRRAVFERALATLPEAWQRPGLRYMHWTQANLAGASIVVLELQDGAREEGPQAAWLGAWCVDAGSGQLVSLGPFAEHSDAISGYRHRLAVVGREGSLPIILYSYFGLEPSGEGYSFFNPSIGPAPHIEESRAP
jgi:hypothetical protein